MRSPGGVAHELTLSLSSGADDLERVRAKECAQRELQRAVRLSVGDWALEPGPDGGVPRGTLVLRLAESNEPGAVDSFGGNVLYTIRATGPARAPLLTLAAGQSEATLPLEVRATRCDAHALAESKQSYVFRVYVTVGGGPAELTTVRADAAGSALLDELAARTCVPGG